MRYDLDTASGSCQRCWPSFAAGYRGLSAPCVRTIAHMSRIHAVKTRLRLGLAIMVGSAVALLMPSLFGMTGDAPSAVLLTALALAVAAVVALNKHVATVVATALPQPRTTNDAPSFLAGRVTDPVHHPLRPRAPGLA